MVSTGLTAFQLSPAARYRVDRRHRHRVVRFLSLCTVTGLVFAKLFFPNSDPWVGTLVAFAI
jgi:hypothetical protein